MPILNQLARNLSPLEEERLGGGLDGGGEGERAFVDLGSTVLTARSCDFSGPAHPDFGHPRPRSLQDCEIFQPMSESTLSLMRCEMLRLWRQTVPMCIEVRGQTTPTGACKESTAVLLEQWTIQTLPHRAQAHHSSVQLLQQAVLSFLHFSQLRSWIMARRGSLPFQLLYRVCAPGEDGFADCETHVFPPAVLSHHCTLQVKVSALRRQDNIPLALTTPTKPLPPSPPSPTVNKSDASRAGDLLVEKTRSLCLSDQQQQQQQQRSPPQATFPFSPPRPSPLSPKLLSGLPGTTLTTEESGCPQHDESFCFEGPCLKAAATTSSGGASQSASVKVRPPSASSPLPCAVSTKRRSCVLNFKEPKRSRAPPQRSSSVPAVLPSLCLLGTFEESVLNGRLEPCGYVDGFTSELGASGLFCPRHLTLPVAAAFFNLSDDGGPSPYLGHVDLSGVGKRGYHVPRQGTVQLTLFNPNKAVVKIFVVTYDLSDMPDHCQTFLRQKTLARPLLSASRPLPALHYLIHLRFHCSKSGRVYLHRDIRLIFARRAPDTDPDQSKVALYSSTEWPDPRYGPLQKS